MSTCLISAPCGASRSCQHNQSERASELSPHYRYIKFARHDMILHEYLKQRHLSDTSRASDERETGTADEVMLTALLEEAWLAEDTSISV